MAYRLPVNEPVAVRIKFADLVASQYGSQVKLKCLVDGAEEHVYLPGAGLDVLTQLHEAGVIGAIPAAVPERDTHGIALDVRARDVLLELKRDAPRARGRLVVTLAAPAAIAPLSRPRSPVSAPAVRTAAAKPSDGTPAPAESADAKPDDARARCEARRRAVTAAFREALMIALEDLAPLMEQHQVQVTGDVVYKMAFSIFQAWREASLR